MKKRPKSRFRVLLYSFLSCISLIFLYILFFWQNHHAEVINKMPYQPLTMKILLQQSPVLKSQQVSRLTAIDISWATWTKTCDNFKKVELFAAIPFDCLNCSDLLQPTKSFEAINKLKVPSVRFNVSPYLTTSISNPLYNLVQSVLQIVKMQSAYDKWLVLANDQTFVIVPNLIQFLAHYDAEELVYTGNELAIGMGSAAVHFASGGAGAVLSMSCARLIAIVWTALQFDFLTAALDSPFQAGSNLSSGGCCSTSGGYSFRDGKKGHPKLVELSATVCGDCALQEVFHWSTRARMDADYSCVVIAVLFR